MTQFVACHSAAVDLVVPCCLAHYMDNIHSHSVTHSAVRDLTYSFRIPSPSLSAVLALLFLLFFSDRLDAYALFPALSCLSVSVQ